METTISRIRRFQLSDKSKKVIIDVIGYLYILLFVYASINKLMDIDLFMSQMGQSTMLVEYVDILAWAVPIVELLIVLMLFIPKIMLSGLYASLSLMLLFTVYITVILTSGEKVPCACGGILQDMSWAEHLVFNVAFVLLGIFGIILKQKLSNKN